MRFEGEVAAEKGRAPSKKSKRRQKKSMAAATASASAVQKLFDLCKEAFADCAPGFVPKQDDVGRLSSFLDNMKPEDVELHPNLPYFRHENSEGTPPVTYLHLYGCPKSKFSIGIFCLPQSSVIPLHNHPGMTVFSKILFGSMHVKSYDWVDTPHSSSNAAAPTDGDRLAKVKTDAVFNAPCETLILYPETGGNMHCFTGVTSCAVLDVLGPPYSAPQGRDCTYYDESPCLDLPDGMIMPGEDGRYAWLKAMNGLPDNLNLVVADYEGPKIVEK
ncbi:plant cysteine oxidase 2-like isoform X1 [Ananas comosus]|uniref:cysteine dioxygenase n=1 Tax=Ananas comosus TaxID=4615 RepID=A0A6P5GAZ5_ANACO|nr:plant cysteine oxidase 2-like isoform X1 [Ananas comosus]